MSSEVTDEHVEAMRDLLSEGLDLCVRARQLDAQEITNMQVEISADKSWWTPENTARRAARHNALHPDRPMVPASKAMPLWVKDQYESDLLDWEKRARLFLMNPRAALDAAAKTGAQNGEV